MAMIYLASESPRRAELLHQLKIDHLILKLPPTLEDEPRLSGESPQDYVLRTALDKSERAFQYVCDHNLPDYPILTADTTVFMGEVIYGKPQSKEAVFSTLNALSNRVHHVHTAVVLRSKDQCIYRVSKNQVEMGLITQEALLAYEASKEPYGKAGAYAIQGLGAQFVRSIQGSYSGIMGLPLYELSQLLHELKLI